MQREHFTYKVLIKYDPEAVIFGEVTFTKDFAPWVASETVDYLEIDYGDQTINQLSHDSIDQKGRIVEDKKRILRSVKFRIVPE